MKKLLVIFILGILLSACGDQETFETVSDVYAVSAISQAQKIQIALPEDAAVESLESTDSGKLYMCDGFCVAVQTMEAGNLDRTIREVSGFEKEQLTVMQTQDGKYDCYEFVWSAAGEAGDQMSRAVLLDDGKYHYVVAVTTDAARTGELTPVMQHILDSVTLVSIG